MDKTVEEFMKTWHILTLGAVLILGLAGIANAVIYPANESWSANLTRSPFPAKGAATVISCITAGTGKADALAVPSQYALVCAGDVYLRFGVTGEAYTGGNVASSTTDWRLPADTVFFFATGGPDKIQSFACDAAATTACTLIEMK
jgi:hypothetical protein